MTLTDVFLWVVMGGFGLGAGLWAHLLLELGWDVWLLRKPGRGARVPLPLSWLLAGGLAAFLWLTLAGTPGQALAPLVLALPWYVRQGQKRRARAALEREVRQFMLALRLELAAGLTLLPALTALASRPELPLLAIPLSQILSAGQMSGLEVLAALAERTKNRWLGEVAVRLEAADAGGMAFERVLKQTVGRVREDMDTEAQEQLQRIPSRLILIAFPVLLGPALIAWIFPLVDRMMNTFQGMSTGGGF